MKWAVFLVAAFAFAGWSDGGPLGALICAVPIAAAVALMWRWRTR